MRQHFPAVDVERFFFVAAHEVNVELGDADFAERVELFAMLFDRADEAETIDHFIAHEVRVVAADFTVMVIVV